tara:strand:+ start:5688 stop:6446 length:759 start_codon:yes stop_codon:yes gene_type:complete
MSNLKKPILRIIRDIMELINDPIQGIEVKLNKENIFNQSALIVGPNDTPYFGGYYFFDIQFPENYPTNPPKINMKTIDSKIRFNPNLYECGKVCLSILGTWSGPSWTNIMTLKTILLSIRSLMNDFPITNEPGYENTLREASINIDYNCYITYFNYKLAILDVISEKKKFKKYYNLYKDEIKKYFLINKTHLYNNLQSYKVIYAAGIIGRIIYFLKDENKYDFIKLNKKFSKLLKINDTKIGSNVKVEKRLL